MFNIIRDIISMMQVREKNIVFNEVKQFMKVNFKKIGVEVEADAESLIEKGINARENDWKEKLESKTKNKKEIIELKHKNKMEEKYFEKNGKSLISKEEKSKKVVRIVSIILFFIYGIFCIEGLMIHI